ncbi:MAG: hypothetical protein RKO66_18295 [Candidatus Contendobacter sp.]|nr:hypothetical protein [Candidatus Contendobacter sp.]MDS4060649.1 hypothetical protein [Candidatus Contendobacter sp.]
MKKGAGRALFHDRRIDLIVASEIATPTLGQINVDNPVIRFLFNEPPSP